MINLILLIALAYGGYHAYAEYKARDNSFSPLDEFFASWLNRLQFKK